VSDPTGPTSFSSGWQGSFAVGKIHSINDRGNRLQVRIMGYQGDTGNIPDDKLEWIGTIDQGAGQIAGASKTHNYYPGSHVAIATIGNQKFVIGALTGYDSDQTNKKDSGADTSENKDPNIPKQARGEGRQYEGQGEDKTAKGSRKVTKTDQTYDQPEDEKTYDHSKSKAPFDKGTASKFPSLKSVGIDKNIQGSDLLNVIDQLDGNMSGAIQAATQLIRNLRQNGFGDAMSVVGAGALSSAGQQHDDFFQPAMNSNLLTLIQLLLQATTLVRATTPQNVVAQAKAHAYDQIINAFSNQFANVDQTVIDNINGAITTIVTAPINVNVSVLVAQIAVITDNFQTGLQQATASIIVQINNTADSAGGPGGLISVLGGPTASQQLAAAFQSLAISVSMQPAQINAVGQGAIGAALSQTGALNALSTMVQNSGGNSPANMIQALIGNMNMFQGNQIALGENGTINPQTLSGIAIKYAKKQINDPQKTFFGD
jgi:hypothetical protein